jgi:hypothetical protein
VEHATGAARAQLVRAIFWLNDQLGSSAAGKHPPRPTDTTDPFSCMVDRALRERGSAPKRPSSSPTVSCGPASRRGPAGWSNRPRTGSPDRVRCGLTRAPLTRLTVMSRWRNLRSSRRPRRTSGRASRSVLGPDRPAPGCRNTRG